MRSTTSFHTFANQLRNITNILKSNKLFLTLYTLVFISGIVLIFMFEKPVIVLFVNGHHNAFLDIVFSLTTLLGEAPIIILALLLILWKEKRNFWQAAAGFSFMGILIYLFKFHVFESAVRPRKFIKDETLLHFVEGISVHFSHSFPSGHTTTAFLGFFLISTLFKNNLIKVLCLILACAVAYSRMYLGQHFFEDVLTGSSLGLIIGVCTLSFRIPWKRKIKYPK